jgi:hypothetical protein
MLFWLDDFIRVGPTRSTSVSTCDSNFRDIPERKKKVIWKLLESTPKGLTYGYLKVLMVEAAGIEPAFTL